MIVVEKYSTLFGSFVCFLGTNPIFVIFFQLGINIYVRFSSAFTIQQIIFDQNAFYEYSFTNQEHFQILNNTFCRCLKMRFYKLRLCLFILNQLNSKKRNVVYARIKLSKMNNFLKWKQFVASTVRPVSRCILPAISKNGTSFILSALVLQI